MALLALLIVGLATACSSAQTRIPAQPSIDASTANELQAKMLSDSAVGLGITDPPEVAMVRETSPIDHDQAVVDCMRQAGYDASIGVAGGVSVDSGTGADGASEEWEKQYQMAMYVCAAQYPLDAIYLAPLTLEQKDVKADYFLDELPKCLESLGIQFEVPPSRDVYLAMLDTQGAWSPYMTAQIPAARFGEVVATCPQFIPPDRLWEQPE